MNNWVKWIILLAMGLPSIVLADEIYSPCATQLYSPDIEGWGWFDGICPSAGIDLKYGGLNGKGNWRHEFPENYPIGNLYLTTRFHEFFAIEVGYEQSANRHHTSSYGSGDTFFDRSLTPFSYERRAELKTLHADFNFLVCLQPNLEFLASIGAGNANLKSRAISKIASTGLIENTILNTQLTRRTIARVRFGLVYHLKSNIGIRALVGMDGTSHLRISGKEATTFRNMGLTRKPFKDMPSVSIGFFVKYG